MHSLVLLQATEVRERGTRVAGREVWSVGAGVDSRIYHLDPIARDSSARQVLCGTLADRLERDVAIRAGERSLGEPDRGRQRRRELLEDGSAEEVRYERHDASDATPAGRVKGNLVHVLDEHIERRCDVAEDPIEVAPREQRKSVPRSDAMYFDVVQSRMRWASRPPAAEEGDLVSRRRK